MRLAVQSVAQAPPCPLAGDRDGAHDLAHVRQPAEKVAVAPRPGSEVIGLGVELVRAGVQSAPTAHDGGASGETMSRRLIRKGRSGDGLAAARRTESHCSHRRGRDLDPVDLAAAEPARHAPRL